AVAILDQFVAERTSNLLPTALVRRGQCFMNIGRLDDAMRDFQEAIDSAPTDSVAFQARLLIGQCQLERDEIDQAERTWGMIRESSDLTATAVEWRTALYSLGKLLYETAEIARRNSAQVVLTGQHINNDQQAQALARFDDAILRLEEFRDRYP